MAPASPVGLIYVNAVSRDHYTIMRESGALVMDNMVWSACLSYARGIGLMAIKALVGVAVLAGFSLLTQHPVQTFFRLLSIAGVGLLLASVATMLLTFRQAKSVDGVPLLLSALAGLLGTVISLALSHAAVSGLSGVGFVAGLVMGGAWSMTTLLYVDGEHVRARGTLWSLAVWGLTFSFGQIVSIVTGRAPAAIIVASLVALGVMLGNSAGLFLRARRVLSARAQRV